MTRKDEPVQKPVFEKLVEDLVGNHGHAINEDRVREHIAHRLDHGARLSEVLREEYVRRNCTEEELNEVLRDPRLVHEERVSLRRLFESGELDPTSVPRQR